jgi:hypothetical protein
MKTVKLSRNQTISGFEISIRLSPNLHIIKSFIQLEGANPRKFE